MQGLEQLQAVEIHQRGNGANLELRALPTAAKESPKYDMATNNTVPYSYNLYNGRFAM